MREPAGVCDEGKGRRCEEQSLFIVQRVFESSAKLGIEYALTNHEP